MKRFLINLIVIIITTIIIGGMYLFTFKASDKFSLNEENLHKNESIKNEKDIITKDIVNEENIKNEKSKKKENENKSNKEDTIKREKENKTQLKPNIENNYDEAKKERASKVFKVNKHTLLQNLAMKDKVKLLYTCRGLSTIDMGNIKEYMKSSNEIEASAEIFKILRQRLSKEDYNEIKTILSPYVNIDYIESNI